MRRVSGFIVALLMGCGAAASEPAPGDDPLGAGGDQALGSGGGSVASAAGGAGRIAASSGGGAGHAGAPATGGSSAAGGAGGGAGQAGSSGGHATDGGDEHSDAAAQGSGGDAGVVGYNPCPAKGTPCAIMPLGDSITAGAYSSNMSSYRGPLFHLANAHGQSITFVGTQSSGPDTIDGVPFPKHHEGHGGYTIDTTPGGQYTGISGLTPDSIKANHPNIVTLMIGTNDVSIQYDLSHAPVRLGNLLDSILAADPNLLLVVAQITPAKDDAQNVLIVAYNAGIADVVKTRADAGKHIAMVDMYGAFTADPNFKTDYMGDNVHPFDGGHAKMADTWYAAIGSLLR
jgi:lysophospholipase L1-like esterase